MTLVVGVLLTLIALVSTLGAGVEFDPAQMHPLRRFVRPLLGSALANAIVIPWAVFALAAHVEPDARLALQLIALSPGGASGPLLARLAAGDPTRISVLYVFLCLLCIVTLSLIAPAALPSVGAFRTLIVALGLQMLPLLAGVWIRRIRPAYAARLGAPLQSLGKWLLFAMVALLLVSRGALLASLDRVTLIALLAAVSLSFAVGGLVASAPRLADATLTGVRNLTLAMLLAELVSSTGRPTLLVATYGLVMYLVASVLLFAQHLSRKLGQTSNVPGSPPRA